MSKSMLTRAAVLLDRATQEKDEPDDCPRLSPELLRDVFLFLAKYNGQQCFALDSWVKEKTTKRIGVVHDIGRTEYMIAFTEMDQRVRYAGEWIHWTCLTKYRDGRATK